MAASSLSTIPPQHQLFLNFREKDLRCGLVSHLVDALKRKNINIFMDEFKDSIKRTKSNLLIPS
ncbi:hypothetical protein HID58_033422 [Brassica napus]|uniref:TIR domain-containing protein n=1 Tax=Brassica napus TaxID=3708 RepID=A0ABQ8C0Z7_BRANA|nr:hypothetical protein HID58_033422 [Brassica napus]